MDPDFEQLMLLKNVTKMTGILHEAQILQLKYYPLIATHAIKSSFTHDSENKVIIFDLEQTKGQKPKDLPKRLSLLEKSVQDLLGDDYKITVQLKGKQIFPDKGSVDGRRKEVSKKSQHGSDQSRKRRVSKVAAKRKPAHTPRGRS